MDPFWFMDTWLAPRFCLLWVTIVLPWIRVYKNLLESLLSVLWGVCPGVELLDHLAILDLISPRVTILVLRGVTVLAATWTKPLIQTPPSGFFGPILPSFSLTIPLLTFLFFFTLIYFYFLLFRDAPVIYGGSQARGQIRDAAASLHHSHSHSHSNTRSETCLPPTPQLTATLDP